MNRAGGFHVKIKAQWDETVEHYQSLDHYILDEAIIQLLQKHWNKEVDTTFYEKTPAVVRDAIFSKPYPTIANQILGYPC